MILGIGCDLVEVGRVARQLESDGRGFLEELFTPDEIAYCEGKRYPARHYAARFAAKEAVVQGPRARRSEGFPGARWRSAATRPGAPRSCSTDACASSPRGGVCGRCTSRCRTPTRWPPPPSSSRAERRPEIEEDGGMSNIGTYEERLQGFDWSIAEQELGYRAGRPHQHRLVLQRPHLPARATARKPALLWEDHQGHEQTLHLRRPARALEHHRRLPGCGSGSQPGERVCLFMDRVPGAVHRLPRHPQDGRHRPAAVLRLRRGVAAARASTTPATAAIITQRKHVAKVRKIRDRLPGAAAHHRRGRATARRCRTGEAAVRPGQRAAGRALRRSSRRRPRRRRCCTTPRARPASPRARSTSTTR